MMTVATLIEALQRLPQNLPVGTVDHDRVGQSFEAGVNIQRRHLKPTSTRFYEGDAPGGAEEVVVLV